MNRVASTSSHQANNKHLLASRGAERLENTWTPEENWKSVHDYGNWAIRGDKKWAFSEWGEKGSIKLLESPHS